MRLQVARFRLEGVTAFAIKDIEALVAPYTGRPIGAEDLEEVVVEAWLARAPKKLADGYLADG